MGGADVGAGSHCRNMGGHGDKDTGGSGPCTCRGDVYNSGNAGGKQFLDDGPHRIHQSTRRIHLDDETLGPIFLGLVDRLRDEFGRNGIDDSVDFDDINVFSLGAEDREAKKGY